MKNVVITGASGQLGKLFVNHLLDKTEYKIYALDLDFINCDFPECVSKIILDISKEQDVVKFFSSIKSIDILINNAGIGVFTPFEDRTVEEFMGVVDVNLKGTFLMCREALKLMKSAKIGKVVNIGSIYGVVSSDPKIYGDSGRNNSEVYSMSKAGVIMLTKYLAVHYAPYNVQINTISPGGVTRSQSNDFIKDYNNRTPAGRMANDLDLMPALDFLISDNNAYTTGQNIIVDGGFISW
jgi:3-oxoacyl-[acyl-carrier protein] reductase